MFNISPLTGGLTIVVIYIIITMFYIPNTPKWTLVGIRPDGLHTYWNVYDSHIKCVNMANMNNTDCKLNYEWVAMQLSPSDRLQLQTPIDKW
tara:strand:+ start:268 stop:543 length:276 start_codon:yes stop_codon:yes gene_type:complete